MDIEAERMGRPSSPLEGEELKMRGIVLNIWRQITIGLRV